MNDTEASCAALTTTGDALTRAVQHLIRIRDLADGYPARGDTIGRSTDPTSSTERAALNRTTDHEASDARAGIEDIRDWWKGLATYLADGSRLAAHHLPKPDRIGVLLCDGRPFEGSEIAWVPHSRAHDNGWHDPLCVEVADDSGLCLRCKPRERRWRERHGLRPRNRNRIEPAAGEEAA